MSTLASGIRLIIFTVLTLLATALLGYTIANVDNAKTNSYKGVFADATNLVKGDEVRQAGVRVGTIKGVKLYQGRKALVSFSLHDDVPMTSTTTLQIRYRNVIGQRYLAVVDGPPGGKPLNKGATITKTSGALNLTTLFNGFRPLLQGLSPGDVNNLSYDLIQVLQGEGGTVDSLLTKVGSLTGTLADHDAVIGDVITQFNDVLGPLDQHDQQLSALIANLQQFITGLSQDRHAIGNSLTSIDKLTTTTASFLKQARSPLKHDIRHLGVLAEKLDSAGSQKILHHFLTYTPFKLKVSTPEASYGAFLNFYVCGVNFIEPDPQPGNPNHTKTTKPFINTVKRCQP